MAIRQTDPHVLRHGLRGLLGPAFAGGLVLSSLTGCAAHQLTAPCAVIVDGSASGSRFDANDRINNLLPKFLHDKKCGTVTYAAVTSDSQADACGVDDVELDPDLPGSRDQVRAGRLDLAKRSAQKILTCARNKNPRSDVLGALGRVATQRPDGDGTYEVLVISDMLQHDMSLDLERDDLSSPQKRRAILSRLGHDERIPNMHDMALEVSDRARGIEAANPAKFQQIAAFWRELFATGSAGSPKVKYD